MFTGPIDSKMIDSKIRATRSGDATKIPAQ